MKRNDGAAIVTWARSMRSARKTVLLCWFLFAMLNGLVFLLNTNKRLSFVDLFIISEDHAVGVSVGKPKEIDNAIQPTFDDMHDFRVGPRKEPYRTGNSKQDLERNNNQTKTIHPLHAGVCKLEGQFKDDNEGSLYAAAWLSSKETLFQNEKYTRKFMKEYSADYLNQELGFFAAVGGERVLYQPLDMFDFFVHHLSGYDFYTNHDTQWDMEIMRLMQDMIEGYRKKGYNNPSRVRTGNVLAIIPFHSGASTGKSGDTLSKTRMYLEATVLTVSIVFPNIAVFVASPEDYSWLVFQSGLNRFLYDVQLVEGMKASTHLCFATSVVAKEKLLNDSYDASFDWIYYTESDQIPHLRNVDTLLEWAMNANSLVIPHRGESRWHPQDVALHAEPPEKLLKLNSKIMEKQLHLVDDIISTSCCFKQNCLDISHHNFTNFDNASTKIFRLHENFVQIAGTGNTFAQKFRTCKLSTPRRNCIEDY
jgi:hypothetical protein